MAKRIPVKGRAYGLGERNPKTLPGYHKDSESVLDNLVASARAAKLGKRAAGIAFVGHKYVT